MICLIFCWSFASVMSPGSLIALSIEAYAIVAQLVARTPSPKCVACVATLGICSYIYMLLSACATKLMKMCLCAQFGHMERPAAWAQHLVLLRQLQARTGGITEFVPLPFVHMEAPIYLRGAARLPEVKCTPLSHRENDCTVAYFSSVHKLQLHLGSVANDAVCTAFVRQAQP